MIWIRVGTAEPPAPYRPAAALGRAGEDLAARHLAGRGFRILHRGYRTRAGEIDLIAEEAGALVFVEVKARSTLACGTPAEAVGARKQRRLAGAARLYLQRHGASDRPCRFDVVEVLRDPGGGCRVHHIRNAFQPD
jgi:putative endonuclease